jgi:hypothetical protein
MRPCNIGIYANAIRYHLAEAHPSVMRSFVARRRIIKDHDLLIGEQLLQCYDPPQDISYIASWSRSATTSSFEALRLPPNASIEARFICTRAFHKGGEYRERRS